MPGTITTAGVAKLSQAQATGQPFIIDKILFSYIEGLDPNATPPDTTSKPTADKIVYSSNIIKGYINNDACTFKAHLPPDVGPFRFNWVGLYSTATDTLVAVLFQPIQQKIKTTLNDVGNIIIKTFFLQYTQLKTIANITLQADIDYHDFLDELNKKANNSHTHNIIDVESLQSTLDEKSPTNHTHIDFASNVHTHFVEDISYLQSTLDEKSPTNHTHIDLASNVHTHFVEDISYLQLTLDTKSHVSHKHTDIVNQLETFATKDLANATNPFLILSASFNNASIAGGSGFLRTKNGLLMQYGSMQPGSTSVFVSFPTPFASRNYMIIGCRTLSNMDTGGIDNTYVPVFGNNFEYKQTTYCRFTSQSGADNFISWIAIGT